MTVKRKNGKSNDKSWRGKFIHSHPCRDEAATWMGHSIGLGWVKEQQQNTVSLPYTTIETTFYLG
jgi:hypothetical protein